MTFDLETRTQRFAFGDSWSDAVSSDCEPDLRKIKQGMGDVSTKDVDFIALRGPRALHFLEVKDFRGHSGDLAEKTRLGILSKHVAQKVRDSIPALVGAHRTSDQPEKWSPFVQAMAERGKNLYVVLWLEEDAPDSSAQADAIWKIERDARQKELQRKLSWLTENVLVEGRHSNAQQELDLQVSDL